MKVAFVGKGGSGKSTISWLAITLLVEGGRKVFAIDADHNMDLTHLLGKKIAADTPTMHRLHDEFRAHVGQKEDKRWHDIVLDGRKLPVFTLEPKDAYSKQIALSVSKSLDIATVGLGAEDILFSDRCAHGHSTPLKYYLPLLNEGEHTDVVIDGVAGADMMHFGLFLGADIVIVVVEPQTNSVRVLSQVAGIAEKTKLPLAIVINKSGTHDVVEKQIQDEWGSLVVGRIPADPALLAYNISGLLPETRLAGEEMLRSIHSKIIIKGEGLERLRSFEHIRQSQKI